MSNFSDGQIRQWREFHPRAVKLLSRHKPFLVVANDEPYYMQVYSIIRKHEKEIGRWSEIDERNYQAAQQSFAADAPLWRCKACGSENSHQFANCVHCGASGRR